MNIEINPIISTLDKEGLCYSIYNQLYHNFFNSHDKKDDLHPWGITEGDEVSIRLHNTAYYFAEVIELSASGSGSGGGGAIILDYIRKSGGDMTGKLRANYGFEAGFDNNRVVEAFKKVVLDETGVELTTYGIRVTGDLEVGNDNLYIGGENVLSVSEDKNTTFIDGKILHIRSPFIQTNADFVIGKDKSQGVFISPSTIQVNGYDVYHSGNANRSLIDWKMKDATVNGNLSVSGKSTLSGTLSALNGFELGINKKACLYIDKNQTIHLATYLSFANNYGIKILDKPVLVRVNETDIQLGAVGGSLLIGTADTTKILLQSDLFDFDGDYTLISKYGGAYFPDGLRLRHNYGDDLLTTYRESQDNEGMVIHKNLRFGSRSGGYLSGNDGKISFSSTLSRLVAGQGYKEFRHQTELGYVPSSSRYQPLNRLSNSLLISTDADTICFSKPIESKEYIGIDDSYTRITDGCLFFTDQQYLLRSTDGIKHYGNAYFLNNLSSERFSSGFAGSGWAIIHNKTTGNMALTVDELTVRKKMRIYELEVQKISATNGSLWVSDNCSGDTVIAL